MTVHRIFVSSEQRVSGFCGDFVIDTSAEIAKFQSRRVMCAVEFCDVVRYSSVDSTYARSPRTPVASFLSAPTSWPPTPTSPGRKAPAAFSRSSRVTPPPEFTASPTTCPIAVPHTSAYLSGDQLRWVSDLNQSITSLGSRLDNLSWDEVNAKPGWTGMLSGVAGGNLEIAATVDVNNTRVKNVAAPTNSHDAMNLLYAKSNYAKISSSDNRLILQRYGTYTTEHDALAIIDIGASLLPAGSTGIFGAACFQHAVPMTAGAQSLGSWGRPWGRLHGGSLYAKELATSSENLRVGGMDATYGIIDPWWDLTGSGMAPVGARDIGGASNYVRTVYTSNVVGWAPPLSSDLSMDSGGAAFKAFTVANVGRYIRPAEATNYDIIAMNNITPVFDDAYNLGQYGR